MISAIIYSSGVYYNTSAIYTHFQDFLGYASYTFPRFWISAAKVLIIPLFTKLSARNITDICEIITIFVAE